MFDVDPPFHASTLQASAVLAASTLPDTPIIATTNVYSRIMRKNYQLGAEMPNSGNDSTLRHLGVVNHKNFSPGFQRNIHELKCQNDYSI